MNGFTVTGKLKAINDGDKGRRTIVVSQPPSKDRQGNEVDKEIHFSLWGQSAAVAKELVVGQTVSVSGKLDTREWQGRHFADFRVDTLFAVSPAPPKGGAEHREITAPVVETDSDEIPF
jgi:hypothetical protein